MDFTFVSQHGFQLNFFTVAILLLILAVVFFLESWLTKAKVERAILHPEKWEQYLVPKQNVSTQDKQD